MYGLDLDAAVSYRSASFRYFAKHEHHVTRICSDDVLLLLFKGILRFEENGKSYELRPGEWHIQKHDSYQSGMRESDSPEYLYIHFRGEWADAEKTLPADGRFEINALMPQMRRMDSAAHADCSLTERNAIFYGILSSLAQLRRPIGEPTVSAQILKLLTADLKNQVSLAELSEKCHISKNQIIRIVKRETGLTPYAYLMQHRMRLATRMLEASSCRLSEVAEECGFSEYTHFFKAFKKAYGMSPGVWRREKQKLPTCFL